MTRAEAVRIALAAADGKNLGVFSPTIGAQLLDLELIDEIDIFVAPILLGDGIRLYHNPGSQPIRLHRLDVGDPMSAVRVRYRPTTAPRISTETLSEKPEGEWGSPAGNPGRADDRSGDQA